jgi:hypothetical protein
MIRKRALTRPLAALLFTLTLALATAGALHVAAHAGEADASGHCEVCRVVEAVPIFAGAVPDLREPLARVGEIRPALEAAPGAIALAAPVSRGPPSHA